MGWGIGLATVGGAIGVPFFVWAKAIARYPKLPAYVDGREPYNNDNASALSARIVICAAVVATGLAIAVGIISAGVALDASEL